MGLTGLELEIAGEKEVDAAVKAARAAFNGPWSEFTVVFYPSSGVSNWGSNNVGNCFLKLRI